jgi:hypothetical protein
VIEKTPNDDDTLKKSNVEPLEADTIKSNVPPTGGAPAEPEFQLEASVTAPVIDSVVSADARPRTNTLAGHDANVVLV